MSTLKAVILPLLFFSIITAFSQQPVSPFFNTYPSPSDQRFIDVIEQDTTLLLLGSTKQFTTPSIELITATKGGVFLNTQSIQDNHTLNPFQLFKDSDDTLVILAEEGHVDHNYTVLIKLGNKNFPVKKIKIGTDTTFQTANHLVEYDNCYYFAGTYSSPSMSFGNDFWVVKMRKNGTVIWDKHFGNNSVNEVVSSLQIAGDKIFLFGDKNKPNFVYNPYVITLDTAGNFISDTPLDWPYNGGVKMSCISDEHIYVTGESASATSTSFDIYLAKYDLTGNRIWRKLLPATENSETGFDIKFKNNHLFITGYAYDTTIKNTDIHYTITDTAGNILKQRLYNVGNIDIGYQVLPTNTGGLYIIGSGDASTDIDYIMAYDTTSYTHNITSIKEEIDNYSITIQPNPFIDHTSIHFSEKQKEVNINVFDSQGKCIKQTKWYSQQEIPLHIHKKGVFFVQIITPNKSILKKLICY